MISHWTVPVFDRSSSSGMDVAQAGQVPCVVQYSITELADGPRETRVVTLKSSAIFAPVLTGPSVPARRRCVGTLQLPGSGDCPGEGRPRAWHVRGSGRGRPDQRWCTRREADSAQLLPTYQFPTTIDGSRQPIPRRPTSRLLIDPLHGRNLSRNSGTYATNESSSAPASRGPAAFQGATCWSLLGGVENCTAG